jgi:UDP-N-acetyl-D-mannosaminuronic acid dehydrogenase
VEDATRKIAPYVQKGNLVILESTSPVGTTDSVVARILAEAGHNVGEDVFIAHCPERVLPGRILTELIENDRIVGGVCNKSTEKAVEFYHSFVRGEVLATNARTAELAKLTENAFRDVNIAFANELSLICDKQGVDVWELIELANRHPRVNILQPGPGVGGHCIAVDPWFIVSASPEQTNLIRTAREVNDSKPGWVVDKVRVSAQKFKNPVIGCLGLAFKADVDDLRESPALGIVRQISKEQLGEVLVAEPNISSHDEFKLLPYQDVIKQSDILLLLVDHKEFRGLKATELKETLLIDTRGVVK